MYVHYTHVSIFERLIEQRVIGEVITCFLLSIETRRPIERKKCAFMKHQKGKRGV
jgi:hypothetical protein